jgi:acetyl-CoA acetyltransferase
MKPTAGSREGSLRMKASAPATVACSPVAILACSPASDTEAATALPGSSKERAGTVQTGNTSWLDDSTEADDVEVDEEVRVKRWLEPFEAASADVLNAHAT